MHDSSVPDDLRLRSVRATLLFAVVLWVLIFWPAGSLRYWQGWLFWVHFTAWTVAGTLYFLARDPALVARRMQAGPVAEREPAQKRIQLFASITICALFIVSAFDYRRGWSTVPLAMVVIGHVLLAAGYLLMFAVFRENSFASSIIEISTGQTVISTGPYALVRHPMYSGALLMFAGVPLALGSWWGLLFTALVLGGLIARLEDEERYLVEHLAGYEDYRRRVRYRLVPGVW